MSMKKLRRCPAVWLERLGGATGATLACVFRFADVRGVLSDCLADPRTVLTYPLLGRFFRRWFPRTGPVVSVIVATRNNATTLGQSLSSLMNQTYRNLEIIVIDDASEDDSLAVIYALSASDKRIIVRRNEKHLGTGGSRNRGLALARGDYVTFHDGDDVSHPARIAIQVDAFGRFLGKKLVLCNYVRVTEKGVTLQVNDTRVMKCIISMMFPRGEVLAKVGYFLAEGLSEDADYYERVKIALGKDCEVVLFRTLYRALFRQNSSFFGAVQVDFFDGKRVIFKRGLSAVANWNALRARHALMTKGEVEVFVPHRLNASLD